MKLNYKDFNKMTEKELCKIPGVGRTTAKRVLGFRPFRNNDDLFKVKGLGKKTLKALGVEKTKKKKKKWFTIDGVDYPDYSLAEPSPHLLRMRRICERIREEGPGGPSSRYVDNTYMWKPGFKFDWED